MKTLDIWCVWPTVNIDKSLEMINTWKSFGYKVACLVNSPFTNKDLITADRVIVQEKWKGFPVAVNILCKEVPGDIVVVAGDDLFPDPNNSAQEIGEEFLKKFPNTFGVMQPTGDEFGLYDKCAVSPWIGRKFIEQAYGGNGPFHEGYFHYWSDHELQIVAEQFKAFEQRPDLIQFHDHWQRRNESRPDYLFPALDNHKKDKQLFLTRQTAGFPGAFINRDTNV